MMTFTCFQNAGELDIRGITLLGASSKRGTEAIGEFGSGFSYALGVLLRCNFAVRVFTGEREIKLDTVRQDFRGKSINVIYVDGQPTSLTLEIGPKWRPEEAVREIWSNALDEGEAVIYHNNDPALVWGAPGVTRVFVENRPALRDMLANWSQFFITAEPIWKNKDGAIYHPADTGNLANYFRRGVWCSNDRNKPPVLSFSFQKLNLPESRVIDTGAMSWSVSDLLGDCDSPKVAKLYLNEVINDIEVHEFYSIYSAGAFTKAFTKAARDAGYAYYGNDRYQSILAGRVTEKVLWVSKNLPFLSRTELKDVAEVSTLARGYAVQAWPLGLKDEVSTACEYLREHGVDVKWPVHFAKFADDDVIARADPASQCVLIGDKAVNAGPGMLLKALIEEWTHLEHHVVDGSVAQQHVYLNLIVKLMEAA